MKRLALILFSVLLMLPVATLAKDRSVNDLFKEFGSASGADVVTINPFMMKIARMFVANNPDAEIIKKIRSVRILDLEDCAPDVRSRFSNRAVDVKLKDLEELVDVRDDGEKVKIMAKIKDEEISRLVVLCYGSDDCCLIEINGNFMMSDIDSVVASQKPRKNGR